MSEFPLKKDCFVSSVTLAALNKLGFESLEWEPLILRDAAEAAFGMKKMPQKMFDKLNCGYMLVGTNAFEASIEGFLSATAIMNDLVFDSSEIPYCTLDDCAWSIWEYINLTGDIEDSKPTVQFCPEIIEYIREAGKLNGISTFPVWLSFADCEIQNPLPDMASDVDVFEMYQARQQEYIQRLNAYVNMRQEKLTKELIELKNAGFVAKAETSQKIAKTA